MKVSTSDYVMKFGVSSFVISHTNLDLENLTLLISYFKKNVNYNYILVST